jgi:hypothetical protein
MATYIFKAMDLAGVPAGGEVEAISKQDVADQLKERGLVVIDIAHKYRSKELNIELFARVKASELAVSSRQLATMVSSGMTILRALYVLESQTSSKLLRETFVSVRHDVEAGLLLSDAIERHPKVFSPLYVAMVKAGETGGLLEEALLRTADQLEKDASLRRQIRAAMIYPAVVISFAIIVMLPRKAAGAQPVHGQLLAPAHASVLHPGDCRRGGGRKLPFLQAITMGETSLGRVQAQDPAQDRGRRPEGLDRPLVAHLLIPGLGGRADHAGDRDHRQDGRQRCRRARDGRRDRVGQVGRHDRRAAWKSAGIPGDGPAHGWCR